MPETAQVQGEPKPGSVAEPNQPATPPQAGSVTTQTVVTPPAEPLDAETLKANFEKEKAQLQRDINQLKSASQRRESELQKQLKQREASFKKEINDFRVSTMDDDERKLYESELAKDRVSELEEELEQLRSEKMESETRQSAFNFFVNNGVPASALILDGSSDDLVQSGYAYMANRMKELEAKVAAGTQQTPKEPPKAPPTAPKVDVLGGQPPAEGQMDWAAIIQKYGSRERFYELLEQGQLPASELKVKKS